MEFQQLQNFKFFATLLAHVIVIVSNLFTESKSFTQDNRLLILGRSQLWHLNMFQKSHNKQQRIGDLEIQTKYKIHWKRYYFHREKNEKCIVRL